MLRDLFRSMKIQKIRTSYRQNPVWLRNQGSNEASEVLRKDQTQAARRADIGKAAYCKSQEIGD